MHMIPRKMPPLGPASVLGLSFARVMSAALVSASVGRSESNNVCKHSPVLGREMQTL